LGGVEQSMEVRVLSSAQLLSNMTKEPDFHFSPEQISELKALVKSYFLDELDTEIGELQIQLFIDFLNAQVGKKYYNLGVSDTIAAIKDKAEDLVLLLKD
jgi:uncharacterized protein (DUF2164 family)